jgi:hypothetical protein
MGGYTSKCEKKSKSLHPTVHTDAVLFNKMSTSRDSLFKVYRIFSELLLPDFKKILEIRRFSTGQCELGGEK